MRISGGKARGIRLKVPQGTRPSSERVRRAVFSSIASRLGDARVLDLYCGSGAWGLEALSRGAREAVFVDQREAAVAACRANARALGVVSRVRIRRSAVDRYLVRTSDGPFDMVFADPPYGMVPALRGLPALLAPGALVVLELRWRNEPPPVVDRMVVQADRRYGDTRVLIYTGADG